MNIRQQNAFNQTAYQIAEKRGILDETFQYLLETREQPLEQLAIKNVYEQQGHRDRTFTDSKQSEFVAVVHIFKHYIGCREY